MDGIDVALIKTDGENIIEHGPNATFAFDADMRQKLSSAMKTASAINHRDDRPGNLAQIEQDTTRAHIDAVDSFLQQHGLSDSDIDIIGFHGQTVLHRPDEGLTVQLGDGQLMANELSIPVIHDLRGNDIAAGGQGAPLVPVYHRALAQKTPERPLAFVNIGGISNVTYVGADDCLLAFDCGPGNALLDDWTLQHTGTPYDKGGELARSGEVDEDVLHDYQISRFFNLPVPKSLDRGDFTLEQVKGLSAKDGARTLTELTARSIANAANWFPDAPQDWIICGGGRRNRFLMQCIAAHVQGIVTPAEAHHLNGDALEAQAFAYLAVRSLKELAITFPTTTGVEQPLTGGVLNKPFS